MPTTTATKLDFIIAGAEKAGTTFFSKMLSGSSEISMPEPEIRHFRDPFYPDRERLDDVFHSCERIDPKTGALRKLGIKHPSYLGRPEVPERIYKHNPDAKLIFILRDPVERAISSYLHYINHGQIPLLHPNEGFGKLVAQSQAIPKYRDILEFGLYYKYINMYLQYFDQKNLLILEFEDFFSGGANVSAVSRFLNVASIEAPKKRINEGTYDWNQCVVYFARAWMMNQYDDAMNIVGINQSPYVSPFDTEFEKLKLGLPKAPVEISADSRRILADFYKDDVAELKRSGVFKPKNW